MEKWRLLNSGCGNAAENMAIDESLLIHHARNSSPPTIRFYCWDPPAISLGYFQQLKKEIDVGACEANGVDVVRRITGGRAIFHDNELTYSLIAKENNPKVSGSITESYRKIAECLYFALWKLGITVDMVARPAKQTDKTAACFDAPSWYELVFRDKKITGSAQTRRDGVVLQHGSIPFSFDNDKFFKLLNFSSEGLRNRMQRSFANKACSLEEALGRRVDFSETAKAVKSGMEEKLDIELVPAEMNDSEEETAGMLLEEKYGNRGWNYKK